MIAGADIAAWRSAGYTWRTNTMVEQDLIISRIVVELFSDPFLREALIFRGGTALNKLCFPRPLRYSEDVPPLQLRIKIEINTREHFRVLPVVERSLRIESRWFTGEARIPVFATEELLGTKAIGCRERGRCRGCFCRSETRLGRRGCRGNRE